MEIREGLVLADRYRLDSLLGQGGMGSVWKAHHITLNSPVAIKLMDPELAATQEGLDRFVREAQAAAALRSPHVVQTLDFGVHEQVPYIAMELMRGESLADRLKRQGRLSPRETAKVLTHVGRAVAKAHDLGIVHRDLKPDNIFLVHNEDEEVAKVLDFGIAKLAGPARVASSSTRTGAVMGTPYYMSPEQAEGTKAVDHRTDIWAMGVIAFECLLGAKPFNGEAIGELILRICTRPLPIPSAIGPVPSGFDAWFARACCQDLGQRFASVRELLEALRTLVTNADEVEDVLSAQKPSPSGNVPFGSTTAPVYDTYEYEPPRQKHTVWYLGAGAAVVVLGVALAYAYGTDQAEVSVAASGTPASAAPAVTEPPSKANESENTSVEVSPIASPPPVPKSAAPSIAPPTIVPRKASSTEARSPTKIREGHQPSKAPPSPAPQPTTADATRPQATQAEEPTRKPSARATVKPRPVQPKPAVTRDPLGTR